MTLDLLGVPLDLGSERIGVDMGPNGSRYQKYVQHLRQAGLTINDLGNLDCPSPENVSPGDPKIKYLDPIAQVCAKLAEQTAQSVQAGRKLIILGGDHPVALGSVAGAANALQGELGLIWIDAHGDLNTQLTTPSGNIHGMPLAVILGHGHQKLTGITKNGPAIKPSNLLGIGFKDHDPPENDFIEAQNLKIARIKDILATGLQPVFQAITQLAQKTEKIWVSFDLDGVDASEAPGVGMPNRGGLTYREIFALAVYIGANCDVLGLDLVEYNPVNDVEHKTAILATELTAKIFGTEYSQYSQYLEEHAL